jgi:RNA polymerase sigma-70 factor (ECF subfamily)
MVDGIQETGFTGIEYLPAVVNGATGSCQAVYESNKHRLYALAFWMTGNELQAEEVLEQTFTRAFLQAELPTEEMLDRALLAEIREFSPLGTLTLDHQPCAEVLNVRGNVKRCDLERAILQVPATERLIYLMHDGESYSHTRIAHTLGISEQDSRRGLHQGRLQLRSLLAGSR